MLTTFAGCTDPPRIPRATFRDGWFLLPEDLVAEVVQVRYRAVFGATLVEWSEVYEAVSAFRPELPSEAVGRVLQDQWLTGLSAKVVVAAADGARHSLDVDPAWYVVTGAGVEWFDRDRVAREAPAGAWGPEARAQVAEQEREGVWVLPPEGGGE